MKISMQQVLWGAVGVVVVVGVVGYAKQQGQNQQTGSKEQVVAEQNPVGMLVPMQIGSAQLQVEVRRDDAGRALGLSYRDSLPENQGMLFVFPVRTQPTFWMHGMKFDLDMIWITDNKVVQISADMKAPTEVSPRIETTSPDEAVDEVLEVNAGWVERNGVRVGDEVKVGTQSGSTKE